MDVIEKDLMNKALLGYFAVIFAIIAGLGLAQFFWLSPQLKYDLVIYEAWAVTVMILSFCLLIIVKTGRCLLMTTLSTGFCLGFLHWTDALYMMGNHLAMRVLILPPRTDPWYADAQYQTLIVVTAAVAAAYFMWCELIEGRDYLGPIRKLGRLIS